MMPIEFGDHGATVAALGAAGALLILQVLIADLLGILRRHVPGTPVAADHGNALFRAGRAFANTNETVAAFVLLVLFAMLSGADAGQLAVSAWCWLGARVLHMVCYYADWRIARSVAFAASLLALATIGITGLRA